MTLSSALQEIRALPGAHVGRNYGLGNDVVAEEMRRMVSKEVGTEYVQQVATRSITSLTEVELRIRPYQLPQDYRAFLELCGGLVLHKPSEKGLLLDVFGIGPGTMYWYTDLLEMNRFELPEPFKEPDYSFRAEEPLPRDAPAPRQLYVAAWHRDLDAAEAAVILSKRPELLEPLPPGIKVKDYRLHWEVIQFFIDLAGDIRPHGILAYREMLQSGGEREYTTVADSFLEWLEMIGQHRGQLEFLLPE